ncbi:hypothetical protein AVEN_179-1 [Araneus ventricosus]|uniref:Secreted protein n=1 Tax=Araneus ventricosus TaxID=182803 RepID=A0A4Y2D3V9_ARAVE|nr:hypothetical protein AVEN_179-1 [Araneus ventricosus]
MTVIEIAPVVLVALTIHGPTPPVEGTYYHWREVTRPQPLLYPQEKQNLLTYPEASHPQTPGGLRGMHKKSKEDRSSLLNSRFN